METAEVLQKLNTLFKEVLNNNSIVLSIHTRSSDIPEWDSLAFIELIVAIEKRFKVEFTSLEIQNWKNVGEMCNSVKDKLIN